ncbi:hypothetical protein BiPBO1_24 [Brucella phage BiPBO1]|uniref:hypothetical protein n=2 Tax=root TaxID=1 RepID=UPI00046D7955|nr:hypothetical protein BJD47_gp24 [Brucella phage BiPBO1]ALJ98238.1 hypothetical protein BiPBO1_24 [Brucella phage BiPBO1]KEY03591.1 hypothetical protein IL59_0215655 [Brucella suis bv. 4 str. 40]
MPNQYSHIEINGGIVKSASVTDDKGTRILADMIGRERFYVDVIEADGGSIGLWDGEDYAEAKREANSLRFTFRVSRIVDKTARAA